MIQNKVTDNCFISSDRGMECVNQTEVNNSVILKKIADYNLQRTAKIKANWENVFKRLI